MSRIRRLLGDVEPLSHSLPAPGAVVAFALLWLASLGGILAHSAGTTAAPAARLAERASSARPALLAAAPVTPAEPLSMRLSASMPLISALLFDPLFAAPQSQSAEEDIEKQLGGVSGVILTTSHEAVSKAVVALIQSNPQAPVASSAQGAQTRTVSSDAAGKFSFDRVPPGFYRLYVSHPVYLNPEALRPLTLTAGQHVSDISVELMEPATVTGLAVDEEGDPVSRANVQVIRNAYRGGIRRFDVIARVDSGDNGEFTIKRVPAGRYIIKADNQPTWTGTERAPVPAAKPGEKVYIPAGGYYGGLTSDTATPIDIAPGQTVAVGKIKMPNRLQIHVRGRVIGDPSLFAEARVTRIQTADSSIPWSYGADIQKDGKFDMSNMWPGSITIGVYSRRNGILGWTAVTAGEEDLEGVSIEASAAPMNGAVRVEGEPEAADRRNPPMRLILTSIGAPAVITLTAAVNPDGAFTIPNAAPGLYAAEVTGLPEGSYLKTVRLSHAPTPDQNIDWRGPDSGTLELGVSTKAARLEGTLVDDDGKPAAGTVTVVPVPARPGVRRLYPTTKANAQGVFSFPSLAPGAYKVYAWEEIESSAHWDPNFILPFESRGESIEVGESGRATLSLKRISSAAMMEVLRKAGL